MVDDGEGLRAEAQLEAGIRSGEEGCGERTTRRYLGPRGGSPRKLPSVSPAANGRQSTRLTQAITTCALTPTANWGPVGVIGRPIEVVAALHWAMRCVRARP